MDTEITKLTIELRKFLRSRVFTSYGIFQETWVGKIKNIRGLFSNFIYSRR